MDFVCKTVAVTAMLRGDRTSVMGAIWTREVLLGYDTFGICGDMNILDKKRRCIYSRGEIRTGIQTF
jgi:hypothetical protein